MKDGKRVVITYGTFDLFHRGHYNMLKRAREQGDYLIVGVTGESYDKGRGKMSVHDSIAKRIENVNNTGLVDQIIIEEYLGQKIWDIIKYNVDVFVIGDDWRGKFDHIARYCQLVYLPRTKDISSTQIREENDTKYAIGLVTDRVDDNQLVTEAPVVSGFSVDGVFSPKAGVARKTQEAYSIPESYDNYEDLVRASDIVFVHSDVETRYQFIKTALEAGKHVISDIPFAIDKAHHDELADMAASRNLILVSNMKFFCTQTFAQLLWHVHGDLVGDVIKFECSISKKDLAIENMLQELTTMALCPVIKLMGTDYLDVNYDVVKKNDLVEFVSIMMRYANGQAIINVGNKIRVENKIEIIGTNGTIKMGDNWWRGNSFEYASIDGSESKKYSTNFNGNGFRLLVRDVLDMMNSSQSEYKMFNNYELGEVMKILEMLSHNS